MIRESQVTKLDVGSRPFTRVWVETIFVLFRFYFCIPCRLIASAWVETFTVDTTRGINQTKTVEYAAAPKHISRI